MRVAGSLVFWGFMLLSSLAFFPVALVLWLLSLPFDRRRWLLHHYTCLWGSVYTWLNPAWRVEIRGRELLDEDRPTILVANHLSMVDILVLFRLRSHYKWVSKIENFRVPLIGWNMSLCRYIPLKRGDKQSAREMMARCEKELATGSSILMFPEGTRSANGRLRSFKIGAFDLAKRNGVPIQPMVIRGTSDALPKHGFVLQGRHPISVQVLDPVLPETFADEDAEDLSLRIRRIFLDSLGEEDAEGHRPAR